MSGPYTRFGPGDMETWGPCCGHPGDPRTDDYFDDDPEELDEPEDDDESI
jgi:hypothetical protein